MPKISVRVAAYGTAALLIVMGSIIAGTGFTIDKSSMINFGGYMIAAGIILAIIEIIAEVAIAYYS